MRGMNGAIMGDTSSSSSDPGPKQLPSLRKPAQSLPCGVEQSREGAMAPGLHRMGFAPGPRPQSLGMGAALPLQGQHCGKELALIFLPCPFTCRPSEGWQDIWPCRW